MLRHLVTDKITDLGVLSGVSNDQKFRDAKVKLVLFLLFVFNFTPVGEFRPLVI